MIPKKKHCVKFFYGKCKRESDSCYFSHEYPLNSSKEQKINQVCLFYLKGHCFHADKCWYLHPMKIEHWFVEWFTDRMVISFNDEKSPDGKHNINDFCKIGDELIFILSCLKTKKAKISNLQINFANLNFANCCVLNIYTCKALASATIESLQFSISCFDFVLKKLDEIEIIFLKSIKLKNFTIIDQHDLRIFQNSDWYLQKKKIQKFVRILKNSYLEYFEIEAIRPINGYDPELKAYIFMIYSLIKSDLLFLKFSLNDDFKIVINENRSKLIFTINFGSSHQIHKILHDFWEGVIKITNFKDLHMNFISDWFSGVYTHQIKISKIMNLTLLELDFRRVNVNLEDLEILWADVINLKFLSELKLYFSNSYIDQKILQSVYNYLLHGKDFLKVFFIRIKIMFINEELFKNFLMIFTKFRFLQKLELNLDLNVLHLWSEDEKKKIFFNNFVKQLFFGEIYMINFCYTDRTYRFQLHEGLENWLLLKKILLYCLKLYKCENAYRKVRKELIYVIFKRIHASKIDVIKNSLNSKNKNLFWSFDVSENESEGAFYERFLQI